MLEKITNTILMHSLANEKAEKFRGSKPRKKAQIYSWTWAHAGNFSEDMDQALKSLV